MWLDWKEGLIALALVPMMIGFAGIIASQILLITMPAQNYWLLVISAILDAGSIALVNPLVDSLLVLTVDPKERARINAILYMIIFIFTSPFGWIAGMLSSVNRVLPFVLNLGLYRPAILSSRQILDLAHLDDVGTLQAPAYFNHIRFGTYFSDLILPAAQEHGFNPLLLTEWLCQAMNIRPGMRVLDLACGKVLSSIFLAKEFDLRVWAADLWIAPTENWQRILAAGVDGQVFPLRAEARELPFAEAFFDAIVGINCLQFFGTDDYYLPQHLIKLVKPGGQIGMVVTGRIPHAEMPAQSVRVFVRPHDFEVETHRNGAPSFRATVCRVHSAGPNVRLELMAESGERLWAEIPQDRFRSRGIVTGGVVFLTPRDVKVFADDDRDMAAEEPAA